MSLRSIQIIIWDRLKWAWWLNRNLILLESYQAADNLIHTQSENFARFLIFKGLFRWIATKSTFLMTSMLVTDVRVFNLATRCVGDNNKLFLTLLAILVNNIHYLLASVTIIQKIEIKSPTSRNRQQLKVAKITVTQEFSDIFLLFCPNHGFKLKNTEDWTFV